MAFFVAEFVLVMQFLWKYIDEIIGKGISLGVLLELIFYFAVRIIPEAVPVTILISSVMVFGNLAEKYELSSMKSAGISLTRIMMAGVLLSIATAMFSLFASNYLKPRANYKFYKRFLSVRKQDASLNIQEGVFSSDFKNFTIRVGKKDKDGQGIQDILIYDNSGIDKKKLNMLVAEDGMMYSPEGTNLFVMDLNNGEQYRELKSGKDNDNKSFIRTNFKSWSKVFDMSDFDFEATSLNSSRKKFDLMNTSQLRYTIDSFERKRVENLQSNNYNFGKILDIVEPEEEERKKKNETKRTLPKKVSEAIAKKDKQVSANTKIKKRKPREETPYSLDTLTSLVQIFKDNDGKTIARSAKYLSEKKGEKVNFVLKEDESFAYTKSRHKLRLHQMYSWAVVCIVFLFIGAPLGSIVKKGGYGYPLLIAIIFFMMFIVLNIMGEKLNKTNEMEPIMAAWLPNLVLIPFAIIISIKALNDSDFSNFKSYFGKLSSFLTNSKKT